MSDDNTTELLVLCGTILQDGELTYDELYKLAEWLNSHPEACFDWPGNLLVDPLQGVWADGKITKTEARQVAQVILQIRKERQIATQRKAFSAATEIASEAARTFNLTRPNLPTIQFSIVSNRRPRQAPSMRLTSAVQAAPAQTFAHSVTGSARAI